MRALIQRVNRAKVTVEGRRIAEIGKGFLLLLGVSKEDSRRDAEYLSKKVANLRVFEDDKGKMNLDIKQAGSAVLSVPQFTLYADTKKGNRPGFDLSAAPEAARELWGEFNALLKENGIEVKEGRFGSRMEVELVNDGPVTILLESR